MNAMGFNRFGDEDVLEHISAADPEPGENDAVIRIKYTSLNMLDVLVRKGYAPMGTTFPHVPGSDVVGTIESLGSNVNGFNAGDEVIANTLFGCGSCPACISGYESTCSKWKVVGRDLWGSYGELVKIPSSLMVRPPENYDVKELACMPMSLSVIWRSLRTIADAHPGDYIVIKGASGNAGIFALLLSKAMGLNTIALTRSEEKSTKLKNLGADFVINTTLSDKDVTNEVLGITNGNGSDFVLESFGSTLEQSMEMLRDGGKVILYGTLTGAEATVDIKKMYLRSKTVIGTHACGKKEFEAALSFVSSKNIRPVINRVMDIKDAAKAHSMLQNSENFGKIVLEHKW